MARDHHGMSSVDRRPRAESLVDGGHVRTWRGCGGTSWRADAGAHNNVSPLHRVFADTFGQRFRRARINDDALLVEGFTSVGRIDDGHNFAIETLDNRSGRAGG